MADDFDDELEGLENLEQMSPTELKDLIGEDSSESETGKESPTADYRPKKSGQKVDDYSDLEELDLFGFDNQDGLSTGNDEEEMTSESARKKRKAKAKTDRRHNLKRLLTLRSGKTEHQDSKKAKSGQGTVKELVE